MCRTVYVSLFAVLLFLGEVNAAAQSYYQVVSVDNAGTITGTGQAVWQPSTHPHIPHYERPGSLRS